MSTEEMTEFKREVRKKLKHYVYRLVDPRNGETFYVGKGTGNQVFSHAKSEKIKGTDELSDKLKRISEIRKDGFRVSHIIHRHGMKDKKTAFEVEAALIDAYPEALNEQKGHDSNKRGVRHAKQVSEQYGAETIKHFHQKMLIVDVNKSVAEGRTIYDAARYAWGVDIKTAEECGYVLAVIEGLVIEVFQPRKWREATASNFPGKEDIPGAFGFIGKVAPDDIRKLYRRKRLPADMRKKGAVWSFRYSY